MANTVANDEALSDLANSGSRNHLLDGFVTKPELAAALGVSERTIDRWVNLRQFPKPAKIGRLILWRQEIVRGHLGRLADCEIGAAPRRSGRARP